MRTEVEHIQDVLLIARLEVLDCSRALERVNHEDDCSTCQETKRIRTLWAEVIEKVKLIEAIDNGEEV